MKVSQRKDMLAFPTEKKWILVKNEMIQEEVLLLFNFNYYILLYYYY